MHPKITSPQPKSFNAANSVTCRYCSEVLAYTLDKVCYGIQGGIRNVLVEEDHCSKKPAVLFTK